MEFFCYPAHLDAPPIKKAEDIFFRAAKTAVPELPKFTSRSFFSNGENKLQSRKNVNFSAKPPNILCLSAKTAEIVKLHLSGTGFFDPADLGLKSDKERLDRNSGSFLPDLSADHSIDNICLQNSDDYVNYRGKKVDSNYVPIHMTMVRG